MTHLGTEGEGFACFVQKALDIVDTRHQDIRSLGCFRLFIYHITKPGPGLHVSPSMQQHS